MISGQRHNVQLNRRLENRNPIIFSRINGSPSSIVGATAAMWTGSTTWRDGRNSSRRWRRTVQRRASDSRRPLRSRNTSRSRRPSCRSSPCSESSPSWRGIGSTRHHQTPPPRPSVRRLPTTQPPLTTQLNTVVTTNWAFTRYDRRIDRSDRLAEPPTSVNQINVAC